MANADGLCQTFAAVVVRERTERFAP